MNAELIDRLREYGEVVVADDPFGLVHFTLPSGDTVTMDKRSVQMFLLGAKCGEEA